MQFPSTPPPHQGPLRLYECCRAMRRMFGRKGVLFTVFVVSRLATNPRRYHGTQARRSCVFSWANIAAGGTQSFRHTHHCKRAGRCLTHPSRVLRKKRRVAAIDRSTRASRDGEAAPSGLSRYNARIGLVASCLLLFSPRFPSMFARVSGVGHSARSYQHTPSGLLPLGMGRWASTLSGGRGLCVF